jgi:hypothetical protein
VKGKIFIWFRNLAVKGVRSFNREIFVFAFFLFLSFLFWYLNSLRKVIEIDLRYPVQYVNPPKNRAISRELPAKLTLNLKGAGFSIIKLKVSGNRAPLIIDFSKVAYRRVPDSHLADYFIVSNGLLKSFSKQLNSEFEIISVKPDTLFFTFDSKSNAGTPGKSAQGIKNGAKDLSSPGGLQYDFGFINFNQR